MALVLRAGGATFAEIARELGLKPGTVVRFVRLGMMALGAETQAELARALGPTRRAGDLELPDTLTSAERHVAELVLAGLPNAEIGRRRRTSPRIVAHQLQAVYDKLSVRSRCELMARLVRSTPDPVASIGGVQ